MGTLRGTVIASEDQAPVEDARVFVRGSELETRTDRDGAFVLQLPAGTHQISIIHPSFSTLNVSRVDLRRNQPAALHLELHPASVDLDEMVVTGQHVQGGIATLIAERRENTAVADVIGAEQMARSGDSNAASALSRVTGITLVDGRWVIVRGMGERYSSMTLNQLLVPSPDPTRRVVPLDLFPAGVIESVVVQKSYSPDLPGEFGGGLVQLRSRDYPRKLLLNVNVATGGNHQSVLRQRLTYQGGNTDFLGVDDGTRALPRDFQDSRGKITRGLPGQGYTAEEISALGRQLQDTYDVKRERALPDLTLVANVGNAWRLRRARVGFVAAGGYKSEYRSLRDVIDRRYSVGDPVAKDDFRIDQDRRQISVSGFLDGGVEFSERHKLKLTTMLLRQTDGTTQLRTGLDDDIFDAQRTILSWVERQVLLQQVSGSHRFAQLRELQVDWRYAFGRASRLEPDRRQYVYTRDAPMSPLLPAAGGNGEHLFGDLTDDTHEAALDLTQPFKVWRRLMAKAKAGALLYRRDREAEVRRFDFNIRNPASMTIAPDDFFARDRVGNGIELREITLLNDNYQASMRLSAGYGMLELPLHRSLGLVAGARVEHARIETSTYDPFNLGAPPIPASLDNVDVLPAATATWRFAEDIQLRAGYGRTLNRPDFRELSPGRYFDVDSNLLLQGNPDIKRAVIDNYDVRVEWYYTPDEVFSVGAFYKHFDSPIEAAQVPAAETIFGLTNSPSAFLYGLELEGRKRFGFITKALDALYLAANFSLIKSSVEVVYGGDGLYHRPLQGQSPWVVNAQLGWDGSDTSGTSASLVFNSAGKRIRIVGDVDMGEADMYEMPIHRLDLVLSQDLPRGFKLGARARNLLNARERWMRDGQIWREFRRGADFLVSLSWSY